MDISVPEGFSIRTITAGVEMESLDDLSPIEQTGRFLSKAQRRFEQEGFEVQSTRIATQSLAPLLQTVKPRMALAALARLDQAVVDMGLLISVGSLLDSSADSAEFHRWAADLVDTTREIYFSVAVAEMGSAPSQAAIGAAARTILAISRVGSNGEANFRFGAASRVPPGTPFFPVAHHSGSPAFSIGLESAGLVSQAFAGLQRFDLAATALQSTLESKLGGVQALCETLSADSSYRFAGIDLSPAPSLAASIAGPIEMLTGQPFGTPATLAACATITEALKACRLSACGYSGLMLPLLEDRVLALRASEGRFGIQDLLFYSSVCGTGLDVIALPGDSSKEQLARLILDMSVLSTRLDKPLAARLLPIPSKVAGDRVEFANPHLTESVVLSTG